MPETNFFWDDVEDNVMEEFDENGNTTATYATEPMLYGSVMSQERNGETRYHHFDGRGSTTQLTNSIGTVTDTYSYTAFGDAVVHNGSTPSPYAFLGSSGYHYLQSCHSYVVRRRMLSPFEGRWASVDPHPGLTQDNPYSHCPRTPLVCTDPSGLVPRGTDPGDECNDPMEKWPKLGLGVRCGKPSVGIDKPGVCRLLFVIGHNYPQEHIKLRNWLDDAYTRDGYCGCGQWFFGIGCCSRFLLDRYSVNSIMPGLPSTTKFISCEEMVDMTFDAIAHAETLAATLCANRKSPPTTAGCPEHYECGTKFAFCNSVEIRVRCDGDARLLFSQRKCPLPEGATSTTPRKDYRGDKMLPFHGLCHRATNTEHVYKTVDCMQ